MTLEEFISKIEDEYLEEALESLKRNPKDMVTVYLGAKEFQRAKLMRSNFIPEDDGLEKSISITVKK